jgi:hypothetical protein
MCLEMHGGWSNDGQDERGERGRGREGVEREEDEVKTAATLIRKPGRALGGATTATVLRSIANGARGRA